MKHCWKTVCWQQHWPATLCLPSMRVLFATLLTGPLFSPLTAPSWERKWPDRTDRMGAISGNAYSIHILCLSARPRCPWCYLSESRIVGSLFSKVRLFFFFSKWTNKSVSLVPATCVATLMRISPTGHMPHIYVPSLSRLFWVLFCWNGATMWAEPQHWVHYSLARFHLKGVQLYRSKLNVGPQKWGEESLEGSRFHCALHVTSKRFVLCGYLVAVCVYCPFVS